MSGFEHYTHELESIDHEIAHYAAVCGIDIGDRPALERCLSHPHDSWPEDRARESLQGLLILRIRIETEMIEQGIPIPPIRPRTPVAVEGSADGG